MKATKTSCSITKQLELQNLGITFLSLITCISILCSSMSFVDDTDLVVDRIDATCDMQLMLHLCNKLHTATGANSRTKVKLFS